MFSNAFTPFQNCSLWAVAFATHGKSVRRGYAPPFSSHVRWGEPGFPVTPLRDTTACAPFSKERRMKLAEATNLDRKSGERGAPLQTFNARRENRMLLAQLPCYRNLDRNLRLSHLSISMESAQQSPLLPLDSSART